MDFSGFDAPAFNLGQSQTATAPAPKTSGGSIFSKIIGTLTSAPKYFLNADIVNPTKELLAGNDKQKQTQVQQQINNNLGLGPKGTSIGKAVEKLAGNTAQLATTVVPGAEEEGLAGKVFQGAKTGAEFGSGAAAANNESAGNIFKGGLTGGITGGITSPIASGILGKIASKGAPEAASAAEEPLLNGVEQITGKGANTADTVAGDTRNIFQKTADSLDRSVINPKENPSPFSSANSQELVDYLKENKVYTPGDNAQQVLEKLGPHYQQLQSQITSKLASDSTTTSASDLAQKIEEAVGNNNRFGGTNSAAETALANTKDILAKAADENGNLDSKTLYSLKNEVQDELGKAFDKVSKGGALTGNEDALMAIRNTLNDALPDEVKQLSKNQSLLYDAAPGLSKSASDKLRIKTPSPFGILPSTRVPSQAGSNLFQTIKSGVAGAADKAGNVTESANDVLARVMRSMPPIPPAAQNLAVPAAVSGVEQPGAQPSAQATSAQADTTPPPIPQEVTFNKDSGGFEPVSSNQGSDSSSPLGVSSGDIYQAMLQDLQTNGGANLSKLNTLYSIAKSTEKEQQPKALTASAATQANTFQNAAKGIKSIQSAFSNTTGTGEGILSKVLANGSVGSLIGGGNVQEVNNAIESSLPDIAKALGSGTSAAELKGVAKQYLPTTSDTQKSAAAKLDKLQKALNDAATQYFGNQSSFVDNSGNSDNAISTLLGSSLGATQ